MADNRADDVKRAFDASKNIEIRNTNAVKVLKGVLAEDPRQKIAGDDRAILFMVKENGGNNVKGAVYEPDFHENLGFATKGFEEKVGQLKAGDEISLAGRWSSVQWRDMNDVPRKAWEFKASHFEKGDVSLSEMKERSLKIVSSEFKRLGLDDPELFPAVQEARTNSKPMASPLLSYVSGNVVDDKADVLVNTVNTQLSPSGKPVMGKGVALAFKEKYPSILDDYEKAIRSGELVPGRALLFDLPDGRKWAALATKDHYFKPSEMEWVDSGLKELGEAVAKAGLKTIALPPPGCGNGGLKWNEVEPLVHKHLANVEVHMYAKPSGAMEPVKEMSQETGRNADRSRNANAKAIAALGGDAKENAPRQKDEYSKTELLAMIPTLFSKDADYIPYAGIGSRETPQNVLDDMTKTASALEARGFTLRSGLAGGADTAFELGTTREDLREFYAPWKGFGENRDSPYEKQRWDQIARHEQMTGKPYKLPKSMVFQGEVLKEAAQLASGYHPTWDRLSYGPRQLHTRNMGQVLGKNLDHPARFEIVYTVDGKATGGTGQAMRAASSYGIPILNLHDRDIRNAIFKELGIDQGLEISKDLSNQSASQREMREGEFRSELPESRSRNMNEVAYFSKVAEEFGKLSNMANHMPIVVDGVQWKSSEALYQALRFPHLPEVQEDIRQAGNAFLAKQVAYEHVKETRPDWDDVKVDAMKWVVTLKKDQNADFDHVLHSTIGRDIVELSARDAFWGAKPQGDKLVGRDVLGDILTQLRDGARMDNPPPGSMLLGKEITGRSRSEEAELPEPSLKASMYFKYGNSRREGFKSETTFDAILEGERTSTTRYKEWGPLERWEKLEPGAVVRFYEDKEMRGRSVDVVVTGLQRISLRDMNEKQLEEWSKVEGWSVAHAKESARKYSEGVQIRYALPESPEGRHALAVARGEIRESSGPEQKPSEPSREASRPSAAQLAAMSDKQKWLSVL